MLEAGLLRASDAPVQGGFLNLDLSASRALGVVAKAEVGVHPLQNLTAYAYGQADRTGWQAGVAARYSF